MTKNLSPGRIEELSWVSNVLRLLRPFFSLFVLILRRTRYRYFEKNIQRSKFAFFEAQILKELSRCFRDPRFIRDHATPSYGSKVETGNAVLHKIGVLH